MKNLKKTISAIFLLGVILLSCFMMSACKSVNEKTVSATTSFHKGLIFASFDMTAFSHFNFAIPEGYSLYITNKNEYCYLTDGAPWSSKDAVKECHTEIPLVLTYDQQNPFVCKFCLLDKDKLPENTNESCITDYVYIAMMDGKSCVGYVVYKVTYDLTTYDEPMGEEIYVECFKKGIAYEEARKQFIQDK